MHSQRTEIKADHGPERPALGAFHQSLQPELCVWTICTCTVKCCPLRLGQPRMERDADYPHTLQEIDCGVSQTYIRSQTSNAPPPCACATAPRRAPSVQRHKAKRSVVAIIRPEAPPCHKSEGGRTTAPGLWNYCNRVIPGLPESLESFLLARVEVVGQWVRRLPQQVGGGDHAAPS